MSTEKSYRQILKSSSIMGGAAGITMLLGMIRTKFAAVLIGSTGVGLIAGFTAIQGVIATVVGLGIQTSSVREIASAISKGDGYAVGRVVLTLRRICWLAGLLGMCATMACSPLISRITFNTDDYTLDIAALGLIILLVNLTGAQLALLQGMRRIGDMARANIGGAVISLLSAIGFYYWLGLRGIVPSLITITAMQLVITWLFARRVPMLPATLTWKQTFSEANDMVKLGLVFMWSGLMVSAVSLFCITTITREISLHAVGLYSAAFALSGVFVNFVLAAMGTDYYPRLTGVVNDRAAMNRLVNEQTEIGLLLALPGLLATSTLAPWILQIFYTREFLGAVDLLQWFILGCLGRVISWPLGYILLALGSKRWLLLTETFFNIFHAALIVLGLHLFGLMGVGIAFALLYVTHAAAMNSISKRLTNFSWDSTCRKTLLVSIAAAVLCFLVGKLLPQNFATIICISITILVTLYALRRIIKISAISYKARQAIIKIPGVRFLAGI